MGIVIDHCSIAQKQNKYTKRSLVYELKRAKIYRLKKLTKFQTFSIFYIFTALKNVYVKKNRKGNRYSKIKEIYRNYITIERLLKDTLINFDKNIASNSVQLIHSLLQLYSALVYVEKIHKKESMKFLKKLCHHQLKPSCAASSLFFSVTSSPFPIIKYQISTYSTFILLHLRAFLLSKLFFNVLQNK